MRNPEFVHCARPMLPDLVNSSHRRHPGLTRWTGRGAFPASSWRGPSRPRASYAILCDGFETKPR